MFLVNHPHFLLVSLESFVVRVSQLGVLLRPSVIESDMGFCLVFIV